MPLAARATYCCFDKVLRLKRLYYNIITRTRRTKDMKPPGEGVQGALSTDLLTRQRITPKLRLHMTAAFDRVACTYKGVCIADDGHGTWKVLGLQPRANTNLYTAASSSSSAYSEGQGAYSTLLAPPPRSSSRMSASKQSICSTASHASNWDRALRTIKP